MFHGRLAVSFALRAGFCVIVMFSVLSLHDLVKFGRHKLPDFVSGVFDFGPSGFQRWPLAIFVRTNQSGEFLHLGDDFGRELRSASFHCFRHRFCPS